MGDCSVAESNGMPDAEALEWESSDRDSECDDDLDEAMPVVEEDEDGDDLGDWTDDDVDAQRNCTTRIRIPQTLLPLTITTCFPSSAATTMRSAT
eukprot:6238184-Pyramimonas_sp.AAC.1